MFTHNIGHKNMPDLSELRLCSMHLCSNWYPQNTSGNDSFIISDKELRDFREQAASMVFILLKLCIWSRNKWTYTKSRCCKFIQSKKEKIKKETFRKAGHIYLLN